MNSPLLPPYPDSSWEWPDDVTGKRDWFLFFRRLVALLVVGGVAVFLLFIVGIIVSAGQIMGVFDR